MPFVDMHDFGDMMVASRFSTPVMDAEVMTLTYGSPQQLLRRCARWAEIRATIAHNRWCQVAGARSA